MLLPMPLYHRLLVDFFHIQIPSSSTSRHHQLPIGEDFLNHSQSFFHHGHPIQYYLVSRFAKQEFSYGPYSFRVQTIFKQQGELSQGSTATAPFGPNALSDKSNVLILHCDLFNAWLKYSTAFGISSFNRPVNISANKRCCNSTRFSSALAMASAPSGLIVFPTSLSVTNLSIWLMALMISAASSAVFTRNLVKSRSWKVWNIGLKIKQFESKLTKIQKCHSSKWNIWK